MNPSVLFHPCYDMHLLFSCRLIFVSNIYRSGYHQCWQIGNYGYHFSFSIFTLSLRSFRSLKTLIFKSYTSMLRVLPLPTYYHLFSRFLLLILYPLHGMWFCHLKLTRRLSRNRYYYLACLITPNLDSLIICSIDNHILYWLFTTKKVVKKKIGIWMFGIWMWLLIISFSYCLLSCEKFHRTVYLR